MELDELKQTWNHNSIKNNIKADIMELIQRESHAPVSAMKKVFKKQILVMAILPLILIASNLNDVHIVFTSLMFWYYVVFCAGIIVFAHHNYRLVRKMENTVDGSVISNLKQQIGLLETRIKWELTGLRIALFFFIMLAEVVPYLQHYRMLDLWHSLSPVIRVAAYLSLLVLQYFMNKKISQRNLGIHLEHLKKLMEEIKN